MENSFFLDALDFWLDLGIRQNIIGQFLQWAILPKFTPSKILYGMVSTTNKYTSWVKLYNIM